MFALLGALTGLAAVLNAVRFNQIPSNAGLGLEMKVIAAVVVGGAAVTGGRGSVAGTLLGVMLLGMIGPALTFLGVSAYWERAIQGAIILAAVAIDALRSAAARRGADTRAPCLTSMRGDARVPDTANGCCCWRCAPRSLIFSAFAPNFFTVGQFLRGDAAQRGVGLLALALTPVIVTGGIDLSVGSMMGLAAVVFGAAWRDGGCRCRGGARGADDRTAGGALNGLLITRLRHSAAHRDARDVLALPRHRRRHHARRSELHAAFRNRS